MNPSLIEYSCRQLKDMEEAGLLRKLHGWERSDSRVLRFQGRDFLNFSSNDYLGLSTHPRVFEELYSSQEKVLGATASRLITGNHAAYEILEREIADFKKVESVLVFSSGYAAAVGSIPALVGGEDFVVMDKLCHACLVDGVRLSGATLRVFPHNHLKRCEELLAQCRLKAGCRAKVLLITESIFSMDGDLAPLADLVALKKKYGAWLMVDEAHATGVLGVYGRGGVEHFGVEHEVEVSMGTLSKALGCVGGFIAGSRELKELLTNRARSLIYSTGLPAPLCRAATAAVHLVREEPSFREKLWRNVRLLEEKSGYRIQSPILPVRIRDERRCMKIAEQLREKGFVVPAIRYPTVGRGKACLRISISAAHTKEDILRLAQSLQAVLSA